jgi:phosphatidylglycerophosphatase C
MDKPAVAAFDFDETLTTKHSLRPFIRHIVGLPRLAAGVLRSVPWLIASALRLVDRGTSKARFLRATICGRTRLELEKAAEEFAAKKLPRMIRPEMAARIQEHRRRGHRLVLVTASPDLYLVPWAKSAGFDAVLATELEFVNERCTGRLATPNCWGKEKAKRLQEWLSAHQPSLLYAYGDNRGDREMLAMADRRWKRGDGAMPALDGAETRDVSRRQAARPLSEGPAA